MHRLEEAKRRKENITGATKLLLHTLTKDPKLATNELIINQVVQVIKEFLAAKDIHCCFPTFETKMNEELVCPCFSNPTTRCQNCDIYDMDEPLIRKTAASSCEAQYLD